MRRVNGCYSFSKLKVFYSNAFVFETAIFSVKCNFLKTVQLYFSTNMPFKRKLNYHLFLEFKAEIRICK